MKILTTKPKVIFLKEIDPTNIDAFHSQNQSANQTKRNKFTHQQRSKRDLNPRERQVRGADTVRRKVVDEGEKLPSHIQDMEDTNNTIRQLYQFLYKIFSKHKLGKWRFSLLNLLTKE